MIRKMIKINEELCNGCGACANACHEGAIGMVDGKARLLRDDYCDGLGNCLPACPTGAITFEEREAAEFSEAAVEGHHLKREEGNPHAAVSPCSCPSTTAKIFNRPAVSASSPSDQDSCCSANVPEPESSVSNLTQWPVQILLASPGAAYFNGAHLLVAADCTAYAHASFNQTFMKNKVTLIGCPKLDNTNYAEKLALILSNNNIQSITILRMEVPCCGGIVAAAMEAMRACGKMIPWNVITLATDGRVLKEIESTDCRTSA